MDGTYLGNRGTRRLLGLLIYGVAWLLLCPSPASADGEDIPEGNIYAQEKGDIVWRRLVSASTSSIILIGVDNHSAIYDIFDGHNDSPVPRKTHSVLEMQGHDWLGREIDLQTFIDGGGGERYYHGAYRRVGTTLDFEKRRDIVETARLLKDRDDPERIQYVVPDGSWASILVLKYRYIFTEPDNGDGTLEIDEIDKMRSDAFTEYAYAANLKPILDISGSLYTNPDAFQAEAADANLLPSRERRAMMGSTTEGPLFEVRAATGGTVSVLSYESYL